MELDFLRQADFSQDPSWRKAFDLSLAVWRVSGNFPIQENSSSEEMLKIKLRKLSLEIISDLAPKAIFDRHPEEKTKLIFDAGRKIESLRAHLRLVQNLNLTKEINCQILDKEYRLLKEELLKEAVSLAAHKNPASNPAGSFQRTAAVPEMVSQPTFPASLANGSGRPEKILKYIRDRRLVQLKELMNFFPELSEKTVRNDLKQLCEQNLIIRVGNGAGSYYQIIYK